MECHLTTYQLVGTLAEQLVRMQVARSSAPEPNMCRTEGTLVMDTLFVATQVVCYGVGIVSASLNIATFLHRRVKWRRLHTIRRGRLFER